MPFCDVERTETYSPTQNASRNCRFLRECARWSITVVLDNARYQRCKLVQELAERLGIEMLFLPPYSPNLNLIERFWKFVKKHCLYSRYYPDSATFQQAILSFIATAPSMYKTELESLLTLKFQTFQDVPIVPEPQPLTMSLTAQRLSGKTLPMAA